MKKLILALMLSVALLSAQGQISHSAVIDWTASPDAATNTTGVYNVYRATGNCADTTIVFAKVGSTSSTINAFTDTTVAAATTYCYEVTFATGGQESVASNLAQAVIPQNPTALRPPTAVFVASVK
jgi:hypothetical protein